MTSFGARGPLLCAALIGAIGCWNRTPLEDQLVVSPPANSGGAGAGAAGTGGPGVAGSGSSGAAGTVGGLAGSGGGLAGTSGGAGTNAALPQVLVPAATGCGSLELATGGGKLAWTDRNHGIVWITTPGETPSRISSGDRSPTLISVTSEGTAFWLTLEGIQMGVRDGFRLILVARNESEFRGLAVSPDGRYVYYSADRSIMRAGPGIPPTEVARHEHRGGPTAIALDGDRLIYVTDVTGEVYAATLVPDVQAACGIYDPMTEELSGINCMLVGAQGSLFSRQVLARPGQAIWGNGASVALGDTSRVSHESITSVSSSITALAANASTVYFLASDLPSSADYGVVYAVPVGLHQKAVPIATGQNRPTSIAVDDKRVYWSTGDCAIMSLSI
jgi:hypothetical protein